MTDFDARKYNGNHNRRRSKKDYCVGATLTARDIRNILSALGNNKSPNGNYKNNKDMRAVSQDSYDQFLKSKWERIE